jgi:hypothetical protein
MKRRDRRCQRNRRSRQPTGRLGGGHAGQPRNSTRPAGFLAVARHCFVWVSHRDGPPPARKWRDRRQMRLGIDGLAGPRVGLGGTRGLAQNCARDGRVSLLSPAIVLFGCATGRPAAKRRDRRRRPSIDDLARPVLVHEQPPWTRYKTHASRCKKCARPDGFLCAIAPMFCSAKPPPPGYLFILAWPRPNRSGLERLYYVDIHAPRLKEEAIQNNAQNSAQSSTHFSVPK